MLQNS